MRNLINGVKNMRKMIDKWERNPMTASVYEKKSSGDLVSKGLEYD